MICLMPLIVVFGIWWAGVVNNPRPEPQPQVDPVYAARLAELQADPEYQARMAQLDREIAEIKEHTRNDGKVEVEEASEIEAGVEDAR
jgi:hypothetical protein